MALPSRQMHFERHAGGMLRAGRAPQHLLFFGSEVFGDADLADNPGADAIDAIDHVPRDLFRDRLEAHLPHVGRMRRLKVVARAHHYVQTRSAGYSLQCARVTPDPAAGRIDDGVAAGEAKSPYLLGGGRLVQELAIVPAHEWIVAEQPQHLNRHRLVGHRAQGRRLGLPEPGCGVEQEVLVHEGDPELLRRDRPQNGVDGGHREAPSNLRG